MRSAWRPLLAALGLFACACKGQSASADAQAAASSAAAAETNVVRVAAASDLTAALREVSLAFEKETGAKVEPTFGSSGMLAKQLANGAPYDFFASANVAFVDDAVKDGACYGDTKALYAQGHIVLFTAKGDAPQTLSSLTLAKYANIAIANPETAPYGRAAKQALVKAGVWDAVKPKLVYGSSISDTLRLAESGNAEVAIVALSLALSAKGSYAPIEADLHDPIDQAFVVCRGAAPAREGAPNEAPSAPARKLAAFLRGPSGRAILKRNGLLLPGESMAERK